METHRTLPFQVKKEAGKIVQGVGRESGENGTVEVREGNFKRRGDQHLQMLQRSQESQERKSSQLGLVIREQGVRVEAISAE